MTISNKLAQSRIDKLDMLCDIILHELELQNTHVKRNFSARSHLVHITLEKYHISLIMKPDYVIIDSFTVQVITPSVDDWYAIFKSKNMTLHQLLSNEKLKSTLTSHECDACIF